LKMFSTHKRNFVKKLHIAIEKKKRKEKKGKKEKKKEQNPK